MLLCLIDRVSLTDQSVNKDLAVAAVKQKLKHCIIIIGTDSFILSRPRAVSPLSAAFVGLIICTCRIAEKQGGGNGDSLHTDELCWFLLGKRLPACLSTEHQGRWNFPRLQQSRRV